MNILVTGAGGFIGNHLCNFLEKKSHKVVRITSKDVDLSDAKAVENFAQKLPQVIDVVIHLAAKMANPNQSQKEQIAILNDNISITNNLVFLLKKIQPKKLINFSSMAVYPNVDGVFDEKSEIKMSQNPDCFYGLAKFCSENIFDFFLAKDLTISHLRIAQVYGEGMYENRIIPVMKDELRQNNTITVFADGKRVSSFIEVNELVKIVNFFVENNEVGIFNIGGESLSYLDLAQKIIKEHGDNKSLILKKAEGYGPQFFLNCEKLKKIIKN